jgi:hypothetical protein
MRRRVSALISVLALTFTFGLTFTGTAAADPLALQPVTGHTLTYHPTSASALANLDAALPNVSLTTVLDSANYSMNTCTSAELNALPLAPAVTERWCWNRAGTGTGDAETAAWSPQGITTSGDADDDGELQGRRVTLSGWHYRVDTPAADDGYNEFPGRYNDARVAFIDNTGSKSGTAPKYRWAYLVVPRADGTTFSAAEAHAGGMVWYGDKLFVSGVGGSSAAIRVFSTNKILQASSASDTIGKTADGKFAAYGYQYVLPQIGWYSYTSGKCDGSSNTAVPCFSSISLDRSTVPNSLVTTEYHPFVSGQPAKTGRLYRYNFKSAADIPSGGTNDYLLRTSSSGATPAPVAYRTDVTNMQGVLSYGGKWYVNRSSATNPSQLWRLTTTAPGVSLSCGSGTPNCWSRHPEGLTHDFSTGEVVAQTEWTEAQCRSDVPETPQQCGRVIFRVRLADLP